VQWKVVTKDNSFYNIDKRKGIEGLQQPSRSLTKRSYEDRKKKGQKKPTAERGGERAQSIS